MNIRTILVPVDFSACSLFVTRQTAELAARLSARLVVLHVAELPAGVSRDTRVRPEGVEQSAHDYLSSDARERLAPFVAAARELGATAEVHVEFGHVVPTILRVADASGADMIVISTHGRTGLARVVLGSVAEGVARQAHVPVMLMRREPRPECNRASCAWCPQEGRSAAEDAIASESVG